MGVDCAFQCLECKGDNARLDLGRAYHYNENAMNKKLAKETLEKLMVSVKRFEVSLRQIEFFGEGYEMEFYDEMVEFLQTHEGHNVWLINDYYENGKTL